MRSKPWFCKRACTLGVPKKLMKSPAPEIFGGPDGGDSVVDRLVRVFWASSRRRIFRLATASVLYHAEVGFALGNQVQDGSRMLAIDHLRLQLGIELAVLKKLSRYFSHRRGFRVADGDIPDQGCAKILNRRDRRRELRAGDQDQRGAGVDTVVPRMDEPFFSSWSISSTCDGRNTSIGAPFSICLLRV